MSFLLFFRALVFQQNALPGTRNRALQVIGTISVSRPTFQMPQFCARIALVAFSRVSVWVWTFLSSTRRYLAFKRKMFLSFQSGRTGAEKKNGFGRKTETRQIQ